MLIVEDSASQAAHVKGILEKHDYRVSVAARAGDVPNLIAEDPPDLVLLDLRLPDGDGFEVCRRIKNAAGDRFLPVIVLTILQDIEAKLKAFDSGADDYVLKPFDEPELLARVNAMLRIKSLNEETLKRSVTDSLTALYNRRFFERRLREEIKNAQRTGLPLSCVEIDVDHFKTVNDVLGHAAGDRVLKELAAIFRERERQDDVVSRYGGEEFFLLLRVCDLNDAVSAADRFRKAVEDHDWAAIGIRPPVTVSCGVSSYPDPIDRPSVPALMAAADAAMYRAKKLGRNRVCAWDPSIK
ncbi:MAG: diguanylate cyclase [Planctomycetota bacterium]